MQSLCCPDDHCRGAPCAGPRRAIPAMRGPRPRPHRHPPRLTRAGGGRRAAAAARRARAAAPHPGAKAKTACCSYLGCVAAPELSQPNPTAFARGTLAASLRGVCSLRPWTAAVLATCYARHCLGGRGGSGDWVVVVYEGAAGASMAPRPGTPPPPPPRADPPQAPVPRGLGVWQGTRKRTQCARAGGPVSSRRSGASRPAAAGRRP
jgi:hypothetical protein